MIQLFKGDREYTKGEVQAALKTLKGDRKLLSKPGAWLRGELWNEAKTAFCLLGATRHVDGPGEDLATNVMAYKLDGFTAGRLEEEIPAEFNEDVIADYNDDDNRKHRDILKFLDRCIAFVEKKLAVPEKAKKKRATA